MVMIDTDKTTITTTVGVRRKFRIIAAYTDEVYTDILDRVLSQEIERLEEERAQTKRVSMPHKKDEKTDRGEGGQGTDG